MKYTTIERCPFCGGIPNVDKRTRQTGADDYTYFVIECPCRVHPRVSIDGESGYGHGDMMTNEEAAKKCIEIWNTRHK